MRRLTCLLGSPGLVLAAKFQAIAGRQLRRTLSQPSLNIVHDANDVAIFGVASHEYPPTSFLAIDEVGAIDHSDVCEFAQRQCLLRRRIDE